MNFIDFEEVEEIKERNVYVEDFSEESFINKEIEVNNILNKLEKKILEVAEEISYIEV